MSKGWPWNREIYALILERLVGSGAKVVAFDCLFPEPAPGDDAFRAALERFGSQAVIGSNFVSRENVNRSAKIPSSYDRPTETLTPKTPMPDERVGFTNFSPTKTKLCVPLNIKSTSGLPGNRWQLICPCRHLSLQKRGTPT